MFSNDLPKKYTFEQLIEDIKTDPQKAESLVFSIGLEAVSSFEQILELIKLNANIAEGYLWLGEYKLVKTLDQLEQINKLNPEIGNRFLSLKDYISTLIASFDDLLNFAKVNKDSAQAMLETNDSLRQFINTPSEMVQLIKQGINLNKILDENAYLNEVFVSILNQLNTSLKNKEAVDEQVYEYCQNYLIHCLNEQSYNYIVSKEEVTDFVLNNPVLIKELSNISLNQQAFNHSCTAKNIVHIAIKLGKMSAEENNLYTELKIYRDIWEAPGGVADMQRIHSYLKKNDLDINLFVDFQKVESVLNESQILNKKYMDFNRFFSPSKRTFIDLKSENAYFIFLVTSHSYIEEGWLHAIALEYENKEIKIYEPISGNTYQVNNCEEILTTFPDLIFTGIFGEIKTHTPQQDREFPVDNQNLRKSFG